MSRSVRLDAAGLSGYDLMPDQVAWADEVWIGPVCIGLAGAWASGRVPLALIRSFRAHALGLPVLVNHLLGVDPVIYVSTGESVWLDYCVRAGGVPMARFPTLGVIYAISRQRCTWWKGARDPDNLPVPDGDSRWIPRAVVHLPS